MKKYFSLWPLPFYSGREAQPRDFSCTPTGPKFVSWPVLHARKAGMWTASLVGDGKGEATVNGLYVVNL